jgi:hypothetical protein
MNCFSWSSAPWQSQALPRRPTPMQSQQCVPQAPLHAKRVTNGEYDDYFLQDVLMV